MQAVSMLETIIAGKEEEVAARKKATPLSALRQSPMYGAKTVSLRSALRSRRAAIIAEVKKASPSRGVIQPDFDPLAIARAYVRGGASALSVLTDEQYFQGRLEYLTMIKAAVSIPVLRKDFVVDPWQLHESKAAGADAVLLIVAALQFDLLRDLLEEARELGMECIVEVHDASELASAARLPVDIIGINNRDLRTFDTDLQTTVRLAGLAPSGPVLLSESGIHTCGDIELLLRHGIHAVLIGESLMRAADPGEALAALLSDVGRNAP